MSASYVRNLVRQWCGEAAASEGVPWHETINTRQNPSDPVWFTVEFVAESHEGNFCDRQYKEDGFISLVFIAKPGIGDGPALTAVEAVVPVMAAKVDPIGRLTLEGYDPVQEISGGGADSSYRMLVNMGYSYSKG